MKPTTVNLWYGNTDHKGRRQADMQNALSLVAVIVRDNWNPDIKGKPADDVRPIFVMSDNLIYRTIQSSLKDLRLSKVAHRLATELTTMVLVQSEAVTPAYQGIKESSVYWVSA